MKRLLILLLSFISAFASSQVSQEKGMYHIKGKVSDKYDNEYIKLFHLQGDTLLLSVDSVRVENGKFHFDGAENLKDFAVLTIGNDSLDILSLELALERGTIEVAMDTTSVAHGTYNDLYNSLVQAYRKVAHLAWTTQDEGNYVLSTRYFEQADSLLCEMMKDNCLNVAGQKLILEYKSEISNYDLIVSVHDYIEKRYKHNPWLTDQDLFWAKRAKDEDERRRHMQQEKFIDIELITPEGERKWLSEYVGRSKFLFIDFWASWCSPCIADIPKIKQVYEKYKDKGLEVLSISMDTSNKSWNIAMDKANMPWRQFVLPANSKATELYAFKGIPHGILIDQDGKIVQSSVMGFLLDVILEALLKVK